MNERSLCVDFGILFNVILSGRIEPVILCPQKNKIYLYASKKLIPNFYLIISVRSSNETEYGSFVRTCSLGTGNTFPCPNTLN